MDEAALDRRIAKIEVREGLYARAKDDGEPAALQELLAQLQSGLSQIEKLRAKR